MAENKKDFTDTTVRTSATSVKKAARQRRDLGADCPFLLLTSGPMKYKKVLLLATETVVGRAETCHVVLADPYVSARHAVVRRSSEGLFAVDLDSANGTLLNGKPLAGEARLAPGDRLKIGDTEFELRPAEK
jgi:FHA domain